MLRTRMTLVGTKRQPVARNVHSEPQQDCQQSKCYARADPEFHNKLYSN